jgi:hypothetical protein
MTQKSKAATVRILFRVAFTKCSFRLPIQPVNLCRLSLFVHALRRVLRTKIVHLDASLDGFGRLPTCGELKVVSEIATL